MTKDLHQHLHHLHYTFTPTVFADNMKIDGVEHIKSTTAYQGEMDKSIESKILFIYEL